MDRVREVEDCGTVCYLSPWHVPCPAEPLLPLCLSLLLFVLSLCQKSLWCSPLKFFLSLTRTVPSFLLTCPASLAQSRFCLRLHSACFWKQFSSPVLLIHPCKACWQATLPSVSLHPCGFQKAQRHHWLTDWLHLKPGSISPLHFGNSCPIGTFANLTLITGGAHSYTPDISKSLTGMFCYCDILYHGEVNNIVLRLS